MVNILINLILIFVLFLSMCVQPPNKRGALFQKTEFLQLVVQQNNGENVHNDSIAICWDPPVQSTDSIKYYELFYYTIDNSLMNSIKTIAASDSPYAVIYRQQLPATDSVFYFCVQSITKSGLKSDIHNSSDSDAVPSGGWILYWK